MRVHFNLMYFRPQRYKKRLKDYPLWSFMKVFFKKKHIFCYFYNGKYLKSPTFEVKNRFMMKLVADAGSTKTAWGCVATGDSIESFETDGINPVRDSSAAIAQIILQAKQHLLQTVVTEVDFYGAGCIAPYSDSVVTALREAFPKADIYVESDLLGAARALCGHEEGIACIMGTGSNSCYYDGEHIVDNVSPLGWILGDEGSGAVLGRLLVGDVLKRQLPPSLCTAFFDQFRLSQADIIGAVYRSPQPNRFLASFVPFLAAHISEPAIHDLLFREFRRFFARNVAAYGRPDLPIHFVGGVASSFSKELSEAADYEGFKLGRIERSPLSKMMAFHAE